MIEIIIDANSGNEFLSKERPVFEIKADAIQVEGFDSPKEAFEALEAAHPMN